MVDVFRLKLLFDGVQLFGNLLGEREHVFNKLVIRHHSHNSSCEIRYINALVL